MACGLILLICPVLHSSLGNQQMKLVEVFTHSLWLYIPNVCKCWFPTSFYLMHQPANFNVLLSSFHHFRYHLAQDIYHFIVHFHFTGSCHLLVLCALIMYFLLHLSWYFTHFTSALRSLHTVVYDVASYLSVWVSLELSSLDFGWWIKVSAVWFDFPLLYLISKSNKVTPLSHQVWATTNLFNLTYVSGLLLV